MKKIIIKSTLITIALVVGCVAVVFAVISFGFPNTICGWCEQLGNYGLAARYASLYYSYTDKVSALGRCVDDSILADDDEYLLNYGVQLIEREDFSDYCTERDDEINGSISSDENFAGITFSYRHYVYGALTSVYYEDGNLALAIGTAVASLDSGIDRTEFTVSEYSGEIVGFPVNNALGTLSLQIIESVDSAAAEEVLKVFDYITPNGADEVQYYETLSNALSALTLIE